MRAGDEPCGRGEGREVRWALAATLAAAFAVRAVGAGQPIVENYVGRQVPTAMVARNLERGSGVLWPRLDTAPSPNYFLVEPPLYGLGVVALNRATGSMLGLEASGRVLSAIATAVAAGGVFLLAVRQCGVRAALRSAGVFAAFPVTIRYGRAFQPDMAMLGAVLAGLACWDRAIDPARPSSRRAWLGAGWVLLAVGLALKILVLPVVAVMAWRLETRGRAARLVAVSAALGPALLWYGWAAHLVAAGGGSRASADNGAIWIGLIAGSARALFDRGTWAMVVRFVAVRAFTPIGAILAAAGLIAGRGAGPWRAWSLAAGFTLAMLAPKLHHEYYFLLLAPAAAAGCGLMLDRLARGRRGAMAAIGVAVALVATGLIQARSTWRTPDEWAGLDAA
ncbi:MAG: ArnT family glycosyltransferase, partial [Isosphaeraceae bacterium]